MTDLTDSADVTDSADRRVEPATTPLLVIRGDASDEEVAALVAVVAALAAGAPSAAPPPARPEWSAPRRAHRRTLAHGPGGWRASSLPG